jgi:hypothetical protein
MGTVWMGAVVGGTAEVDTDPAIALSVIIPRCDGVGKPLKKTHFWYGGTGVRTRDLPNVKWRGRRLATVLGGKIEKIWNRLEPHQENFAVDQQIANSLWIYADCPIEEHSSVIKINTVACARSHIQIGGRIEATPLLFVSRFSTFYS